MGQPQQVAGQWFMEPWRQLAGQLFMGQRRHLAGHLAGQLAELWRQYKGPTWCQVKGQRFWRPRFWQQKGPRLTGGCISC